MPEGSSQYIYLQNKNWRAIGYNWDILSQYDNTNGKLYCLTDFQAAWLLSNTEYMRWSTRWVDCPCTQADMDAMKAEMEFNLMSCIDFQAWQVQAIYDGMSQAEIAQYESDWNGSDPSSVNPSAPDDFFNGDDSTDRNDALCTALTIWTYSYVVDWTAKASTVLGLVTTVGGFLSGVAGVGGVISTLVIKNLIAPIVAQFDAMQNITAVNQVICDWLTGLDGTAITPSNWANAVSSLSYAVNSDEWYIQDLLSSDTELLSNFLSFVNSLGDSYDLAQIGVSICPCNDQQTIVVTFDGLGYTDYSIVEGTIDNDFGNPLPSLESNEAGGGNAIAWIRLDFPTGITYVGANFNSYNTTHPVGVSMFIRLRNSSDSVIATYSQPNTPTGSWQNFSNATNTNNVYAVEFFAAITRPAVDIIHIDNCELTFVPQ